MRILKASAGSGKTYNLSKTYLDLLLGADSFEAYRHILAVTFTNKATAEMKSRILSDLYKLSAGDPKAKKVLVNMLHDYSAFSVSTIDKFFQQTLKAFSREIGQFADYQIELDRKSLIREAMDRVLDSLTEDKTELIEWIKAHVTTSLESGKKPKMEDGLYDMGYWLKSEQHRVLAEKNSIDVLEDYSPDRLEKISAECRRIIDNFHQEAKKWDLKIEDGKPIKRDGNKNKIKKEPELAAFFEDNFQEYNTAFILNKLIYSLGLAREFYAEFDALLKEKNLMCLDESNTILRDIINGSDAPFVYEKLGVRYEHFLLDEFQDTSNIQWENFLPLLKESESKQGKNLIVGDVKQSIYRFRDSEWKLLGEKVTEEFPKAQVKALDGNWRSAETIVHFNNAFFKMAAEKLGFSKIYEDVSQKVMNQDPQKGFVRVSFNDEQFPLILESIDNARHAGASYSDIAVLVRNNKEGVLVADQLISAGIPVISDDSLNLKSSVVVRSLIALLSAFDNPDDKISSFFAASLGVVFPESYHSLVDFAEQLLRSIQVHNPEGFDSETLFVQAFMDELQSWTSVNGNNLRSFLSHWEGKDFFIASPENSEAVRVMTIHKSKGLEFPYVIFPYANKLEFKLLGQRWCYLPKTSGLYPVPLNESMAESHFRDDYDDESIKNRIDNINIFYVALTRAVKCLHIISSEPSKTFKTSLSKSKPEYKSMTHLLYEFVSGNAESTFGTMYDFTQSSESKKRSCQEFPSSYCSIDLAGRLQPSEDAFDFFDSEGGFGSARLRGVVLHEVLSSVTTLEDLPKAVMCAVREGKLSEAEAAEAETMLRRAIESHPEWFLNYDASVLALNEVSIFDAEGQIHRPDRVIVKGREVAIVDFKFGAQNNKYKKQLARYAGLYEQLGYTVKSASIWYVEGNIIENV